MKKKWPRELLEVRYAHRGLHSLPERPENSLAAFRAAAEAGFGAELDVHLMKDGNLAVIHDSSLLRTAGTDVAIEDLTREDLPNYHLENTKERIPLLEEVLPIFEGKTPLIVELKPVRGNHRELAKAAVTLLDRYQVIYCMESFDPRALEWLKKNRPEIIRGQLSGNLIEEGGHSKILLWAMSKLLLNFLSRPDFIAYDYRYRDNCLPLKLYRRFTKIKEFSWTVRDNKTALLLEKKGNQIIFEGF